MVNASKYFNMFPTKTSAPKFIGILYPKSGIMYLYDKFHMGTRNSPNAAGRFGAAFIRLVINSSPIFSGKQVNNSIQSYFTVKKYVTLVMAKDAC